MQASTVYSIITLGVGVCMGATAEIVRRSRHRRRRDLASRMWKQCPNCAEMVKDEALICRYCEHTFTISPRLSQ